MNLNSWSVTNEKLPNQTVLHTTITAIQLQTGEHSSFLGHLSDQGQLRSILHSNQRDYQMENNTSIDLTDESKNLRQEILALRKEYSELMLRKEDMVNQEKPRLTALYLKFIGNLQYEQLQIQLDIRVLKVRQIFLQKYINQDRTPDLVQIDKDVKAYENECSEALHSKAEQLKAAQDYLKAPTMSKEETAELKHLFQSMVKALHPDLHPGQSEEDKELFFAATEAYKACNLDKLRELYLMLDTQTFDYDKIKETSNDLKSLAEQLREKVATLKVTIEKLNSTFPFIHREHLFDDHWIAGEQERIKQEISQLKEERKHLQSLVAVMEEYKSQQL